MIDNISWLAVYPEIVLLVMACVIALVDLGVRSHRRTGTYVLTLFTLAVVAGLQAMYARNGSTFYGFGNMVVSDAMGNWLKCFATIAVMVTLVYGRSYAADRDMLRGGELFTLSMFALLGMFIMISGNHLLVIYLGLELLTLSSYALVALRRDDVRATEAAMKYFVLGAMASGFLLYGLSMLYGATGSLDIGQVFKAVVSGQVRHQVLVFGLVFVVSGLAFKLGVVPFHLWIPDVYHGAPTAVTLMIGAAPKLAAFAITIRLLVDGLLPMAIDWQQMLAIMAICSLLLGNLAAIAQTNLKRMLTVGAQFVRAQPLQGGQNAAQMLAGGLKAVLFLNTEPVFDSAAGAKAISALDAADMVVTMSPFKANMEFSDVLLPIAPFTETSGSFVNAEGRLQSFHAVVRPLGETRPAWKVLRVLGNMLELPGFEFESSQEVLMLATKTPVGQEPVIATSALSNQPAEGGEAVSAAGEPVVASIYQLDGLVRRAPALQRTADARGAREGGVA